MKILVPLLCTTLAALGLAAWFMWPLEMLIVSAVCTLAFVMAWRRAARVVPMGGERCE